VLIEKEENVVDKVFYLSLAIKDHDFLGTLYLVIPGHAARVAYNGTVLICEAHGVGFNEVRIRWLTVDGVER
jgi:hypothetical protein